MMAAAHLFSLTQAVDLRVDLMEKEKRVHAIMKDMVATFGDIPAEEREGVALRLSRSVA
jgi:hypothetical protein